MHDSRIDRLADLLLDHSCAIERGERVLIEAFDLPEATLVCRLVEKAAERGAVPLVSWKSNAVLRSLYKTATVDSMKSAGQIESAQMELVQAYIGIRGAANSSQFADVPHEKMDLYRQVHNAGGHLKLSGVQRRVETMLTMTGAQNFIEIHADEPTAVKSFGA